MSPFRFVRYFRASGQRSIQSKDGPGALSGLSYFGYLAVFGVPTLAFFTILFVAQDI
jgi:hypothetical protein